MPSEGESGLVMDWRDFTEEILTGQHLPISYYLELTGDEYEGEYTSIITYSPVFTLIFTPETIRKEGEGVCGKRYRSFWQ